MFSLIIFLFLEGSKIYAEAFAVNTISIIISSSAHTHNSYNTFLYFWIFQLVWLYLKTNFTIFTSLIRSVYHRTESFFLCLGPKIWDIIIKLWKIWKLLGFKVVRIGCVKFILIDLIFFKKEPEVFLNKRSFSTNVLKALSTQDNQDKHIQE